MVLLRERHTHNKTFLPEHSRSGSFTRTAIWRPTFARYLHKFAQSNAFWVRHMHAHAHAHTQSYPCQEQLAMHVQRYFSVPFTKFSPSTYVDREGNLNQISDYLPLCPAIPPPLLCPSTVWRQSRPHWRDTGSWALHALLLKSSSLRLQRQPLEWPVSESPLLCRTIGLYIQVQQTRNRRKEHPQEPLHFCRAERRIPYYRPPQILRSQMKGCLLQANRSLSSWSVFQSMRSWYPCVKAILLQKVRQITNEQVSVCMQTTISGQMVCAVNHSKRRDQEKSVRFDLQTNVAFGDYFVSTICALELFSLLRWLLSTCDFGRCQKQDLLEPKNFRTSFIRTESTPLKFWHLLLHFLWDEIQHTQMSVYLLVIRIEVPDHVPKLPEVAYQGQPNLSTGAPKFRTPRSVFLFLFGQTTDN